MIDQSSTDDRDGRAVAHVTCVLAGVSISPSRQCFPYKACLYCLPDNACHKRLVFIAFQSMLALQGLSLLPSNQCLHYKAYLYRLPINACITRLVFIAFQSMLASQGLPLLPWPPERMLAQRATGPHADGGLLVASPVRSSRAYSRLRPTRQES